jgi:hypothetical protein
MRWRIPLIISLALFVVVSCDQQPVEPPADQFADAPTFKIEDAPPFSGIVERLGLPDGATWVDDKSGLRLIIGFDVVEYCGGTEDFDLVWYQDLYRNNGWQGLGQGEDMRTSVWPFLAWDCDMFTTVSPVASGLADLIVNDNAWSGFDPDKNRANSWGKSVHGHLNYTDGGAKAVLSAHIQQVYSDAGGYKVNSKISLH